MCGRFDNLIARDAYRGLFKAQRLPKSNFPPRYNIAPTDQIPIVRIDPRDGKREVIMARWGLIPFWMKEKPRVRAGLKCGPMRASLRIAASALSCSSLILASCVIAPF
jgi:putative SOS response-associated peptidase YedK